MPKSNRVSLRNMLHCVRAFTEAEARKLITNGGTHRKSADSLFMPIPVLMYVS